MGKGKPRHFPDKPQNNKTKYCPFVVWRRDNENIIDHSHCGFETDKCKGLRHSCVKQKYKRDAIYRDDEHQLRRLLGRDYN